MKGGEPLAEGGDSGEDSVDSLIFLCSNSLVALVLVLMELTDSLIFLCSNSLVALMFAWVNLNFVANFPPHICSQAISSYVVPAAATSQIPLLSVQATLSVPKSACPRVAHFIITFPIPFPIVSPIQTPPWIAWQIAFVLEAAYPHSVVQSSYVSKTWL